MYQPKFAITNKILKYIGIVEAAREVILNAPLLPAYEKKFREEAIVRTVHHGTHIEGNELNLTEAEQVIKGNPITAHDRDIQEVLNYRNVLLYLDNIGKPASAEASNSAKASMDKSAGKGEEEGKITEEKI